MTHASPAPIGFGKVAVRWPQLGFGKTSSTAPDAQTRRSLSGFKDGTRSITGTDTAAFDRRVWATGRGRHGRIAGGSHPVARRIPMNIETWDRTPWQEQEDILGRDEHEGAPVGKARQHDEAFLKALKPDSPVRIAFPDTSGGAAILRREHSVGDGTDGLGPPEAGPLFPAHQRDPRTGFIPVQTNLAGPDALNEYIQHVGSALFAVPPSARDSRGWWGRALFT